jgi:lysophospholipase L1-like esterase
MLAGIAGKPPFAHVKFLDLRPTLKNDATYKTWWANELHPTEKGYEAIAAKFAAII